MRGITEERLYDELHSCSYDSTREAIEKLIDECTELTPWKPIDKDTPTDRALLIVFDDREIYTGIMRKTDAGETYWLDVGGLDFSYGTDIPTHWMELPQPPTTQDQNAIQVEFDVPYGYEVELSKPSDYPKDGPGMYIKFRLRKISKPGFIKEDRVKLLEYKPEIQR